MQRWKQRTVILVGAALGTGLLPGAPGTWGTLPAVAVYAAIAAWAPGGMQVWLIAAALAAASVACVIVTPWAEAYWKKKDPGAVVIDEVAGFLLTVLLWRTDDLPRTLLWSFVFTRVLDIVKIPPARQMERLPGGWGVLTDDLMSSLYAAALLHVGSYWLPDVFGAGAKVLGFAL